MNIKQIHYKTTKTARIFEAGPEHNDIRNIWIGLHGYGQLPQFFIKKLMPLIDENTRIYCPEGLSKYYLDGTSGRIGASWMTREDRLTEIDDYTNYLQQFADFLLNQYDQPDLFVLGFSQGGATAIRWLTKTKPSIQGLVLWSALFPEDIAYSKCGDYFKTFPIVHAYGNSDPYYSGNEIEIPGQPDCIKHLFVGGHTIPADELIHVRNKLITNKI